MLQVSPKTNSIPQTSYLTTLGFHLGIHEIKRL